jgi:transposase
VKRPRRALPAELPRVETLHDIPLEEKTCGCGNTLVRIGEETCEKLEVVPPQIRVRRHVRPKYACKACEGSGDEGKPAVRIAPAVAQLLPKSIASPALVAYMLVAKFCDALPFYRQEQAFGRLGIQISRQDMANWSMARGYCQCLWMRKSTSLGEHPMPPPRPRRHPQISALPRPGG